MHAFICQYLDESVWCRTSGNLCLSFSMSTCNDASVNSSIEVPQVTVFMNKAHNDHRHIAAVILGALGGVIVTLCIISLSVFLYLKRKDSEVRYTESMQRKSFSVLPMS